MERVRTSEREENSWLIPSQSTDSNCSAVLWRVVPLFVRGQGKTSLVDELHRSIVARRGLFAKGKFDLLSRDTSCLLGAFRNLVVQLMVTDAEQWNARILRALSPNAQVLCDVVPELTRLLGEQPPVPVLGTAETANRLNICFLQFVGCLATSSSPLVLFVDDLQWVRLNMHTTGCPAR